MVKLIVPILLIGLCLVSDLYIYHRYISNTSMWRWLWWLPMLLLVCFFAKFLFFNQGFIAEYNTTNLFLLLMMLTCVPKILFSILSLIPKVGPYLGIAAAIGIVYIVIYGITAGFSQFTVREVTFESKDVPRSFDGYRIAQFSDAHVGSFRGPYAHLLKESIDKINSLKPDLVCFVGDIENFSPEELIPHREAFSSLRARDGVMTIMGNHDYSSYISVSEAERRALVQQTRDVQRSFGWDMLVNEHRTIHRADDSICIIGEENWGLSPFPQYGNIRQAVKGAPIDGTFCVMLSHDPNAWLRHILPVFRPAITLSGHTHGTQFSLFGWSPSSMVYDQWGHEYYMQPAGTVSRQPSGDRPTLLSVSTGFGGNFPFRFNMPREVVLITLKHKD